MDIYTILPALNVITFLLFAIMGFMRFRQSTTNKLLTFICLIGTIFSLDYTILMVTDSARVALTVSRVSHIFLMFVIPLYLHLAVEITTYRNWMPLVYVFYVVAAILSLITHHPLYITGSTKYYFGYFGNVGPLMYGFLLFVTVSFLLSFILIAKRLIEEKVPVKRVRAKYILLSFGVASLISQFDIITLHGIGIYPLGTLRFLPMILLAYAVFKHDVMDWKVFLNKGLVFTTLFSITLATFLIVGAIMKRLTHQTAGPELIYTVSMAFAFVVAYFLNQKVQNLITLFLQRRALTNRQVVRELSFEILRLYHVETIRNTVVERLATLFLLERCEIRMVSSIDEQEGLAVLDDSYDLWHGGFRLSVPIRSQSHPSYLLLGDKGDLSLYTSEEAELLTILSNHIALAFDNAEAYKKIEDFSQSLENMVNERTIALIQNESLAAVGRLAAGVAHELNNPLAGVMSTLEYHIDHASYNTVLREDLTFSLKELMRMQDIVKSLLDSSRPGSERKELVNIHNPIDDALTILYNEYKNKKITLEKHLDAKNCFIIGNTSRLCQVFINFLKNAVDSIGDNPGRIRISTSNRTTSGNGGNNQTCIFTITDTGEGMEKEIQKDIFKPFFTTKPPGKGFGLGLYIVHEILRDHSATVEVESSPSRGATFTVVFPAN